MQSEPKEKQEKAKGKLQSDIQCTFYYRGPAEGWQRS